MQQVSNEQWARYLKQYEGLMWKISSKISGDAAIAGKEDNFSDLCVAAMESIHGFKKLTGEDFDTAFENKLFDQYTKTVLWNRKAKKGVPLTNKMEFRRRHVSISGIGKDGGAFDHDYDLQDYRTSLDLSSLEVGDLFKEKSENAKKVVSAIVKDPSVVNDEGTVCFNALVKPTGLTLCYVRKAVNEIRNTLTSRRNYVK
tara:strand:+ start:110831 stop:111430 length:600 start_codon:yes stop_codon:yes gene_type:complete